MFYSRHLKDKLLKCLAVSPIVLLTGGRQTGKTTLMRELANDQSYTFLSLDDLRILNSARQDPIGLLETFLPPLIIDEIQRVPQLALPIKFKVDENRNPGMYLLTGSSNPLVVPKLNDSLAGRMLILHLWPLSQAELRNTQSRFLALLFSSEKPWGGKHSRWSKEEMINTLLKGGYPSVQTLSSEMSEEWFNSHLRTLLERDVQDFAQIRKIEELPNLLQLLANRSSSLLNIAELSRTIKMPQTTLNFYLTLLEALFLIIRQPAWHKNVTKKMTKSPKIYALDAGMMAFLIGANEKRLSSDPSLLGILVETFVVTEIEKLMSWDTMRLQSYHYRTATGIEVDILLENRAGEIVGIEVKSSVMVHTDDFKGLHYLREETGSKFIKGIVLYSGEEVIPFGDRLYAVPLSALWS